MEKNFDSKMNSLKKTVTSTSYDVVNIPSDSGASSSLHSAVSESLSAPNGVDSAPSALDSGFVKAHPHPAYKPIKGDVYTLLTDWYTKNLAKAVWENHKEKQMLQRIINFMESNDVFSRGLSDRLSAKEPSDTLSPEHDVWAANIAAAAAQSVGILSHTILKKELEKEIAIASSTTSEVKTMPSDADISIMLKKRRHTDGISGIDSRISKLAKSQQPDVSKNTNTMAKYLQPSSNNSSNKDAL